MESILTADMLGMGIKKKERKRNQRIYRDEHDSLCLCKESSMEGILYVLLVADPRPGSVRSSF